MKELGEERKAMLEHHHNHQTGSIFDTVEQSVATVLSGLKGVLLVMSKKTNATLPGITLTLLIDYLQLLSFAVPSRSVSGIVLQDPFQETLADFFHSFHLGNLAMRLFGFIGSFSVAMALVAMQLTNIFYVAYCWTHQRFNSLWTIKTLRYTASLFVGVLYIPIVSILGRTVTCSSSVELDPKTCEIMQPIVGTLLTLFIIVSLTLSSAYFDSSPASNSPGARSHSRVDVLHLSIKTAASLLYGAGAPSWGTGLIWSAFIASSATLLAALYLWLLPNLNTSILLIRAMCVSLFALAAVISFFHIVTESISDPASMCISVVLTILTSRFLVRERLRSVRNKSLDQCRDAFEVELKARQILQDYKKRLDQDSSLSPNEEDPELLEVSDLYKHAVKHFHQSAIICAFYAEFLMSFPVKNGILCVREALLEAERRSPAFDISFMLLKARNRLKQSLANEGDVMSYVASEKYKREALDFDKKSCTLLLGFWKELSSRRPDLSRLRRLATQAADASNRARVAYSQLIKVQPKSATMLEMYSGFLASVANDSVQASQMHQRAATLNARESLRNANGALAGLSDMYPVVSIDGTSTLGEIMSANAAASDFLQETTERLVRRDIRSFLVPPLSTSLENIIATYFSHGSGPFMNQMERTVVLTLQGVCEEVELQLVPFSTDGISYSLFLTWMPARVNRVFPTTAHEGVIPEEETQQCFLATDCRGVVLGVSRGCRDLLEWATEFPEPDFLTDLLSDPLSLLFEPEASSSQERSFATETDSNAKYKLSDVKSFKLKNPSTRIHADPVSGKHVEARSRALHSSCGSTCGLVYVIYLRPLVDHSTLGKAQSFHQDSFQDDDLNTGYSQEESDAFDFDSFKSSKQHDLYPLETEAAEQTNTTTFSSMHGASKKWQKNSGGASPSYSFKHTPTESGKFRSIKLSEGFQVRSPASTKERGCETASQSSGSSSIPASVLRSALQRQRNNNRLSPILARLRKAYLGVLVLVFICTVTVHLLQNKMLGMFAENVAFTNGAGLRRFCAVSIAFSTHSLVLLNLGVELPAGMTEASARKDLLWAATKLHELDSALFEQRMAFSSELQGLYETPTTELLYELNGQVVQGNHTLFDASSRLSGVALKAAESPLSSFTLDSSEVFFLLNNIEGEYSYLSSLHKSTYLFVDSTLQIRWQTIYVTIAAVLIAILAQLVMTFQVMRPIVFGIEHNKTKVLNVFMGIPVGTVKDIADSYRTRLQQVHGVLTEDMKFCETDEQSEIIQSHSKKGKKKKSTKPHQPEKSPIGRLMNLFPSLKSSQGKVKPAIESTTELTKKAFKKSNGRGRKAPVEPKTQNKRFMVKMGSVVLLTAVYFFITFWYGLWVLDEDLRSAPPAANLRGLRRKQSRHAMHHLRMFLTSTEFKFPNYAFSVPTELVEGTTSTLGHIHDAIMYGDEQEKTVGLLRLKKPQRSELELMFSNGCSHWPVQNARTAEQCQQFDNNAFSAGLDGVIRSYVQDITRIKYRLEPNVTAMHTVGTHRILQPSLINTTFQDLQLDLAAQMEDHYMQPQLTTSVVLGSKNLSSELAAAASFRLTALCTYLGVLVILYLFWVRRTIRTLDAEVKHIRSLLLMIPEDALDNLTGLQTFLADEFLN